MKPLLCGLFGKLPFHGDFLRFGDEGPVELLDRWFNSLGIDHRRSPAMATAFTAAGPAVTQFPARGRWWTVVMFPSQDSVGRRYPFFAFAGLDQVAVGDRIGLLPVAMASIVQRIFLAHHEGWGGDQQGLRHRLDTLGGVIDLDAEEQRFLDALHACSGNSLFGRLAGSDQVAGRVGIVGAIAHLAMRPELAAGLRLEPMMHQLHWGFWTTLLILLRPRGPAPTMTVLRPGGGDRQPSASALWTPQAAPALASLLWPGTGPALVLADPVATPRPVDDQELRSLLDDGGSGRDLLHGLVSIMRRSGIRS